MIQVVFYTIALICFSATAALARCFNFDALTPAPLVSMDSIFREGKPEKKDHLQTVSGKKTKETLEITWAATHGKMKASAKNLLDLLLDHNTTKSSKIDEMNVETLKSSDTFVVHLVGFLIKPFLFVKVKWQEKWLYQVTSGTLSNPNSVLISYEKVEGTDHIKHLCGNMMIDKISDNLTSLFLYEEAKATNRSVEDTLNGLIGTFNSLSKKAD